MENYGLSKQAWFKACLELPNGIPSDDTFRCGPEHLSAIEMGGQWDGSAIALAPD